jgi:uncharacterized damage-inducible protein DinB
MTTTMTKTRRDVLLAQWADLGKKVTALGEALPAARWAEAPVEGTRSPDAVFRHLIFWNRHLAQSARGESPDGSANEIAKKEAPTRARALAAFEASVAEATAVLRELKEEPSAGLEEQYVSFLGHTAEHYGQLAVYARLAGVVPPASR